jgi:hypothetical protein
VVTLDPVVRGLLRVVVHHRQELLDHIRQRSRFIGRNPNRSAMREKRSGEE